MTRYRLIAATQEERRMVLRNLIAKSGLSRAAFADAVAAGRHQRTVYRWLSGEAIIPDAAWSWLCRIRHVGKAGPHLVRITVARERALASLAKRWLK